MRWSLLVLALGGLLPGCLQGSNPPAGGDTPLPLSLAEIQARLSQPTYDAILREEAMVEGTNGTRLGLNIFRPQDATEPVPVILQMSPYAVLAETRSSCTELPRGECALAQDMVDFFVPRGYAVAFADARGHHDSGGCTDHAGPDSWQDGYDVVEWLAVQPWSNGRVGMYGASYDADLQVGTAILAPPHLVTIVPTATTSNLYGFYYYDGIAYQNAPASMAAYAAFSAWPGTRMDPKEYPERLTCQPEHAQTINSPDWNAYWEARDFRPHASRIQASVLQVHGLQDSTVKPDHVDGFWNNITSEKRLILGQWGHAFPDRPDWPLIRHRWLDHYLKGIDTGILQDLPSVLIEDTTGAWRAIDSYPPLQAETLKLYLAADGTLSREPPAEGTLTIQDYPRANSEGYFGQVLSLPGETATGNPRLLAFETEPLDQDLYYTGRPYVHLVASTNAKSTHWVVRLVDADHEPDDPTAPGEGGIVNYGFLNTRHRLGVKEPRDLTPGETYEATVRLYPNDDVFDAGNRIRVVLNNNDPKILQDTTFATSTIYLGPKGTYFLIPLAPAGAPVPEDALRQDLAQPN